MEHPGGCPGTPVRFSPTPKREAGQKYFAVPLREDESQRCLPGLNPKELPLPNACVEYISGNLPIVLTVPHGGYISPPTIPSRRKGCLEHDDCSQELARAIYAQMVAHVNAADPSHQSESPTYFPHLVVLHLNRLKVDVNRPLDGAVDHPNRDSKAVQAHKEYHGFIEEALQRSVDEWGFAHLYDIHGQSHRQIMEFGFLLSTDHLRSTDDQLDGGDFLAKSSLYGMQRWHGVMPFKGSFSLSAVVRGDKSLGALLQAHGFDSPSQTPPFRPDMPYFWGAWTTRHYAQSYQQQT